MPPTTESEDVVVQSTATAVNKKMMNVKEGGDSNASVAASNPATAAATASSVPFSCNFCQRSFPRLSLLKKHEQVHQLKTK